MKETFIGSSIYDDLALVAITVTLPFEEVKPLPDGKKTWLSARLETLETGGGQTLL